MTTVERKLLDLEWKLLNIRSAIKLTDKRIDSITKDIKENTRRTK